MVSLRRRKYLGLCSGRSSLPVELPKPSENGRTGPVPQELPAATKNEETSENNSSNSNSSIVHPLNAENQTAMDHCETLVYSPLGSGFVKKESKQYYPGKQVKRRKQYRRKQYEHQEPCIMRGVYFKNMKWQAAIKVDKKQIHLGTVDTQEEAAQLYDRAAFMCGREPNFDISEEEKRELEKYNWDDFLTVTRNAIASKKSRRKLDLRRRKKNDEQTKSDESDQ